MVGGFAIKRVAASGNSEAFTSLVGRVYDGATPQAVLFDVDTIDGDCVLLVPRVPFCDPPCGGQVCTDGDVCVAYPSSQTVGAVTVTGMLTAQGDSSFVMSPIANNYQPPASVQLGIDALAEGAAVELVAAGSAFTTAFTLAGVGIASLELTASALVLDGQHDVTVAWTQPAVAGDARVHLRLDISHHGGTRGKVECDTQDDGAFAIPAALTQQLVDRGIAGFPTLIVSRDAVTRTAIANGVVQLTVASSVEVAVDIPGLVSCSDDSQCQTPQTCGANLSCS